MWRRTMMSGVWDDIHLAVFVAGCAKIVDGCNTTVGVHPVMLAV